MIGMVIWATPKFSLTVLLSGIGTLSTFLVTALVQGQTLQILMSAPSYILMIPLFIVSGTAVFIRVYNSHPFNYSVMITPFCVAPHPDIQVRSHCLLFMVALYGALFRVSPPFSSNAATAIPTMCRGAIAPVERMLFQRTLPHKIGASGASDRPLYLCGSARTGSSRRLSMPWGRIPQRRSRGSQ